VLQRLYKSVTRVLQECYNNGQAAVLAQECYKSVTRALQGCYKGVTQMRNGCWCYSCVTYHEAKHTEEKDSEGFAHHQAH
jgi:hypothetical protein